MSKRYPGNFITGNPVALTQTSNNGVWDLADQYQAHTTGTWQEVDGIHEIGRSLRFRQPVSAYLERTPAVSGNRRTWTYSTWVKFGSITNGNTFNFGLSPQYGGDGGNECQMYLLSSSDGNAIRVYDSGGSAGYFVVRTTTFFRDPNAWYHIVVAVDTTLAAPVERVKIYVNGVLQPLNIEVQVSQNALTGWNHTFRHRIGVPGYTTNSSQAHDGYLTEINHIDGQALDPSYFGYFDSITNIWQPKRYTGGYGTNGFYLPFSENQTTLNLGRNFVGSNYFTYSEQFDNAAWSKYQSSVSANATTAPDGTTTADKLVGSTGTSGDHQVYQSGMVTAINNGVYTFSCYAKAAERSILRLYIQKRDGSTYAYSDFNLSTGQIDNTSGPFAGAIPTITSVGNGWYRCAITLDIGTGAGGVNAIVSYATATGETAGYGLFIWGAQINLGSTVDPYIPTVASNKNNDWTVNNISLTAGTTYDSAVDSPVNVFTTANDVGGVVPGNYCTLNPLQGYMNQQYYQAGTSVSNANLTFYDLGNGGNNNYCFGTMAFSTGKWYWEVTPTAGAQYLTTGVSFRTDQTWYTGTIGGQGIGYGNGSIYSFDSTGTTRQSSLTAISNNQVLGIAVDADNKTIQFYVQGNAIGTAQSYSAYETKGQGLLVPHATSANVTGATSVFNFGQRAFAYTPPAGYKSLCTTNMQAMGSSMVGKAAVTPNKWFDINVYGGTGASRNITNSGFQPDLVWIKHRNSAENNNLYDSARGPGLRLESNSAAVEFNYNDRLTSFNNNGFGLGSGYNNTAGTAYAAWQWKQSPIAGLNIVSYTGNGSNNRAISHNLGVVPDMIIVKDLSVGYNWDIYHKDLGISATLIFTSATTRNQSAFGSTAPTSSSFFTQNSYTNTSGSRLIAYVFAKVPGFSDFGLYVGNESSSGTVVHTGFKPKYVLIKSSNVATQWYQFDSAREPNNEVKFPLFADTAATEATNSYGLDFLSNGFKIRAPNGYGLNNSGKYIYMAFAESPFGLNNRAE